MPDQGRKTLVGADRQGNSEGMTLTQNQTDHQLKLAINDELTWSPNVKADHVGVSITDGAVTLSGEVESYPEKAAAVRAALRVHGVTAIADAVVVSHGWGSLQDADIAREAGKALRATAVVPTSVKAAVHNHEITLSGTVAWNYQREAAEHAVAGLSGVTAVHGNVKLTPTLPFSVTEAKTWITSALVRNAQMDAEKIRVYAKGSQIDLIGTVNSWSEFRQAGFTAWATPGVTHVNNQLKVLS